MISPLKHVAFDQDDSSRARDRGRGGFTLIELLVVIAIIAVLAALLLPALSHVQRKANTTKAMGNLRQVGALVMQYSADNGNTFPPTWGTTVNGVTTYTLWQFRLLPYLNQPATTAGLANSPVFWSPNAERLGGNTRHFGMNIFVWHGSSGWNGRALVIPEPSKIVIIGETNKNSDAFRPSIAPTYEPDVVSEYRVSNPGKIGLYMFADGHVEALEGDQGYSSDPKNHPKWRWWMDEKGNQIPGLKP